MPKAWSDKDERQYAHVLESEKEAGRSEERAKPIAAATVNQQRTKEGRTKAQREGAGASGSKSRSSTAKSSRTPSTSRSSTAKSSRTSRR